ncbi:MAG: GspE/PulE family protein [Patescibacteria group bacterium]|nr:GspE/PulE family protein [Patescibacteria group bacterium]
MATSDNQPDKQNPIDNLVDNLQRQKEEEYAQKLATKLNLEYRNMSNFQPNPSTVPLVPKQLAQEAQVFAFDKKGQTVFLALTNPQDPSTQAALKTLAALDEYTFRPILVSDSSMRYLLSTYDTFAPTVVNNDEIIITEDLRNQLSKLADKASFEKELKGKSVSETLTLIFAGASGMNASDIHIEPTKTSLRLRYRLDGVLQDVAELSASSLKNIVDRIKFLSHLKLNITESSQDGRLAIKAGDITYDIRVSILPTQYGESVVMRLLPQDAKFIGLDELGLSAADKAIVDRIISQPNGLILNTGPTGSGKTTTLYSVLNTINSPTTKIITVEDPVEYRLAGVTQTQVNEEEHYDFANALRSIVRQDPDIILVGEIRDEETADIAINASLTGHLVLSTLHTNDAPGAIPRLIELGAKPNLFADALRLIIAQRLVRKIDPTCAEEYDPTPEDIEKIKSILPAASIPTKLMRIRKDCQAKTSGGYKGRLGIFELLEITPNIKDAISQDVSAQTLRNLAITNGMKTLAQDGMGKVLAGLTTLEELFRVVEE